MLAGDAAAFVFTPPRGSLDWRSSQVLSVDPAALLHPSGASQAQLAALSAAAATLRASRVEVDPRQSDGVNAARLLRVCQLLQLASQWDEAVNSRDADDAAQHIHELQARLEVAEQVCRTVQVCLAHTLARGY